MTFADAFADFIGAIEAKDWDRYVSYVDLELELNILLPFGPRLTTREDFLATQQAYFASDAAMATTVLICEEADALGFAVILVKVGSFAELPSAENNVQICMAFRKLNDAWKLSFIQNTKLDGR